MRKIGFDSDKYLRMQSEYINERVKKFGNKLYLEFGGKLFDDFHASRVMPGFLVDSKVRLLDELADIVEIVLVINASDIESSKIRGDIGITYDEDVLRLIDAFRQRGLYVGSVVITQYSGQASADNFRAYMHTLGIKVYIHYFLPEYPTNIPVILSEGGYGRNDYIKTSRPLVVVTAPGPGSGKMAVCLSQLYNEHIHGVCAGYAKFETFPVWNLPLSHPVNLAYEAATADLDDLNMIDNFHLDAYGTKATSYNRDLKAFPILNAIFDRVWGETPYKSPTDMGVNMAGFCLTDDEACKEASLQEIIRRYYDALCEAKKGRLGMSTVQKLELLMNKASITPTYRPSVNRALEKSKNSGMPCVAIELADGAIITGKTSSLLGASSAALLNALKTLAGIDDDMHLISPILIEPIQKLKLDYLGNRNPRLHTDEVLIALSISAATNPIIERVLNQLPRLKNCEAHSTVILSQVDVNVFRKLGVNITCEPKYQDNKLYHKN